MLIGSKSSSEKSMKTAEELRMFQRNNRTSVLELLSEKRNLKEPVFFNKPFKWKQV